MRPIAARRRWRCSASLRPSRVRHAISRARREGSELGVIFLDIDDFKTINDRHGHAFGDHVLKAVSGRLQSCARAGDVVAIQLPNVVELAITYLAAARIGAIASPFPIQYREHELGSLGRLARVRTFVTMDHVRGRANARAILALR